jgi:Tfp pilus assembly protein PilW
MSRFRALAQGNAGTSLVELLVAIILAGVLGSVVLSASILTHKDLRIADDETRGQEDVSVAVERLSRDLRQARGAVCDGAASDPNCAVHLQLWIDSNSNYKQDADEVVTWRLQASAGDPGHYNMIRTVNGTSTTMARTIVQNVAFAYDVPPGAGQPGPGVVATKQVTVSIFYDAVVGRGTSTRQATFTTLLRNVA